MARYIKANYKVAQYLHLEHDRNRVKDGNYLLWQADMLAFGRLAELPQILERIGGIVLSAYEARQEQDGTVVRELPTAADDRFVAGKNETETEQTENTDPVEGEPEPEQPTDSLNAEKTKSAGVEPEQAESSDEAVKTTNEETEA